VIKELQNPCKDGACHPDAVYGSWRPFSGDSCMISDSALARYRKGELRVVEYHDNIMNALVEKP